jgi:hypothetical protein
MHCCMEQNTTDSTSPKIELELQTVLDWTQRELIVEQMIPGPFSPAFHLDDVLTELAGTTYCNHRGTVIYSAALAVHRTYSSRVGTREEVLRRLEAFSAGLQDGIDCLRSPRTIGYATTADAVGQHCIGINEEPAVPTVGLRADVEGVDIVALERARERVDLVCAKIRERRPRALVAGFMGTGAPGTRSIGPISFFCYELYKMGADGRHQLDLEDVATIVGELKAGDSEQLRLAALDRVKKRYLAVRKKLEN